MYLAFLRAQDMELREQRRQASKKASKGRKR